MPADINVLSGSIRPFTQDRNVRPAGAIQQHDQRQQDCNHQAGHHVGGDDAHQCRDRQREVGLALGIIALEFGDVEQPQDRAQDDGAQHRIGQVLQQRRQKQDHRQDHASADQGRELGALPGRFAAGGAGQAHVNGDALEEARTDIGGAHRQKFLVGIDIIVILRGKSATGAQRLPHRQEDDPCRPGDENGDHFQADKRELSAPASRSGYHRRR